MYLKFIIIIIVIVDLLVRIFIPSLYILQSVRGHSAIVLTVTINGMQEIHPVIYLPF